MKQSAIDYEQAFISFHTKNPGIYDELVRLVRAAKESGRHRVGVKMLWEVVRWTKFIESSGDEYKLNNNFHSRYARMVMSRNADLNGVFELRELKT